MHSRPILFPALLAGLLLAGCSSTPESSPSAAAGKAASAAPAPERCSSEPLANLVGRAGSRELLEQARQRAGAERARMLAPDDVVTLEYDSQRLNLYLDEQGRVRMASCG